MHTVKSEIMFGLHLLVTLLAWVAPFLVTWWILAIILGLVMLQFLVFGKCLMNEHHDLGEEADATFYSHLLERLGLKVNRPRVKVLVRRFLYPTLTAVAYLWQVVFGVEPVLF